MVFYIALSKIVSLPPVKFHLVSVEVTNGFNSFCFGRRRLNDGLGTLPGRRHWLARETDGQIDSRRRRRAEQ